MQDSWYYARDGQQLGPVTLEQLQQLLREGQLRPDELIWTDGMPSWEPASSHPSLTAALPSAIPGQPAQPLQYATPAQGPMLGYYTPPRHGPRYGGFWMRFLASFVDSLILLIPNMVLSFGTQMLFRVGPLEQFISPRSTPATISATMIAYLIGQVLTLVAFWLYSAGMESSAKQATLGKQACGLYVTDGSLARLSFRQASLRAAMKQIGAFISIGIVAVIVVAGTNSQSQMLSTAGSGAASLVMLVGYCMAAFTERKRALHDMIAGTLVVYR